MLFIDIGQIHTCQLYCCCSADRCLTAIIIMPMQPFMCHLRYEGILMICKLVRFWSHLLMVINPRRMRRRVTVVVLCVCLSVCLSVNSVTAAYFVCESQARVIWFLMAFQSHVLCGFRWKRFVLQFWRHLLRTATFHHRTILPRTLAAFRWTEWTIVDFFQGTN